MIRRPSFYLFILVFGVLFSACDLLGLPGAEPESYDLSVTLAGSGSGRVESTPAGINCGTKCREAFEADTSVTLTAEPDEGSSFVSWSGACQGDTPTCALTMNAAQQVTARFDSDAAPDGAPTITSFAADKTEITAGESVTFSWEVTGAESFVLEPVGNVNGSSFTVTPDKTDTYVLEATNDAGTATSDPVEVTVSPSPTLPQITSFTADPAEIAAGDSAQLSWTVTGDGPVTVSIDNGGGDFEGSGSTTVSPSGTTSYTLTATNDAGSVDDSLTVTVTAEPPPPTDEKITLLIAGQSNASSRGLLGDAESIPQVRMLGNDYVWVQAAEPTDSNEGQVDTVSKDNGIGLKYGAGHSFGVKLGKELYNATGQNVYLIQSAKGGSCVNDRGTDAGDEEKECTFGSWHPRGLLDRDTLFGSANYRAQVSAGKIDNPNPPTSDEGGAVTGIIWYQGESDQNNSSFIADTKTVMNGFRRELGSDLPIIYVQLARRLENANSNRGYQFVREYQRLMETGFGTPGNELDNFYMVVAHDLPMIQPNHVATEGQKILGERIALAYREHVLGEAVDGTGPRLQSLSRSGKVVTVMTNQQINNHSTYENYFTVNSGGEQTLANGGISKIERDPSGRGVQITLRDMPGGSVTARYMPPSDRPAGVQCAKFCSNETDFNYGPIPPQLKNVVKNAVGLPLPAFDYLEVPNP